MTTHNSLFILAAFGQFQKTQKNHLTNEQKMERKGMTNETAFFTRR